MKQFIRIITISIIMLMTTNTFLRAEYLFLRDGSITKCTVENESATSITVRLEDGKQLTVDPKNVIRILYTELYLGKIFVNKTDGTVIEGYMVDEDQTTYTLRKDLYKPQEFVIRRDEVLFTTRKNPTGLTGTPRADTVVLNWKAPYSPVRKYRIYFKSGDEYKLYGESGSTSIKLKGLRGNTQYSVKVTAIDRKGYESLPSNVITIVTPNSKPEPPSGLRCRVKTDARAKQMTARLTWKNALDPDGKVKAYNIYKKDQKGYSLTGAASDNSYEVKGLNPGSNYYFVVRTVDDRNIESDNSRTVNTLQLKGWDLSLEPFVIVPLAKFDEINELGFGALINATRTNVGVNNLDIGMALGFWYFMPATEDVTLSYMLPLFATLAYRIDIVDSFSIAPEVAFGFSYNSLEYKIESSVPGRMEKKNEWSIEPVALAGISLSYIIEDVWFISAGADYGMVIETDGVMSFVAVSISAGRKF